MPMPHRTFVQMAKRRLVGKEGKERIREIRILLDELPDYRSGPYADVRKWLTGEVEETRVRAGAIQHDSIAVRREGAAQIALVGPATRTELGIGPDEILVGAIANLKPDKGLQYLVRAAAIVTRAEPRVRFLVVGKRHHNHARYALALLDEAAEAGLDARAFRFAGPGGDLGRLREPGSLPRVAAKPSVGSTPGFPRMSTSGCLTRRWNTATGGSGRAARSPLHDRSCHPP